MAELGIQKKEEKKIKRSQSFSESTDFLKEDLFSVQNRNASPNEAEQGKDGKKIRRSLSFHGRMKELKDSAVVVPHLIPERTVETERQEIRSKIEEYHAILESEEKRLFRRSKNKNLRVVKRTRFADLIEMKKKKRVDNAVNARLAAAQMEMMEPELKATNWEHVDIERERCIKEIRGFMMLTEQPFPCSKAEEFVRNLKRNYELCETAWHMKKWVSDAVEGGYFPADISMEDVEAKINRFGELKRYLDAKRELIRNPFYQYLAKEDIAYNDAQLGILERKTGNETLREYLRLSRELKALPFYRSAGMEDVRKSSEKEGKRQTELLKTREEKRDLVRIFSEEAQDIKGNQRFRDREVDSRFTPEVFLQALERFRKMEVKDLHFAGLRDIAEHFQENTRLFDETREFEHLLFVAFQRELPPGTYPSDDEMIRLRAKITAFKNAEYMICRMQLKIVSDPAVFTDEQTCEEFCRGCRNDVQSIAAELGTHGIPLPGTDMDAYYKGILEGLKREHRDRETEIATAYGIMHPRKEVVVKEGEEKETTYRLGAIPPEELQRRRDDYQRIVFSNEYIGDLARYSSNAYSYRAQSYGMVYARKKGKEQSSVNRRVLSAYTLGMSSKELQAVIDAEDFGTEEEKEKLWEKILAECAAQNFTEESSTDEKVFLHNLSYKYTVFNTQTNLGSADTNLPESFKTGEKQKWLRIALNMGTGCGAKLSAYPKAFQAAWCRSLPLTDWLTGDPDSLMEFAQACGEGNEKNGALRISGRFITKSRSETLSFVGVLRQNFFNKGAMWSARNKQRKKEMRVNTASILWYEELKYYGLHKDVTKEELKTLRAFCEENLKGQEKEEKKQDRKKTKTLREMTSQEKIDFMEEAFSKIMSFDLSLFTFRSYMDIADRSEKGMARFLQCREISRIADEIPGYLNGYSALMGGANVLGAPQGQNPLKYRLKEEDLKEISARAAVIRQGGAFFGETFLRILQSPALGTIVSTGKEKIPLSLDEIVHLSEAEINERKAAAPQGAAGDEERKLWDTVLAFIRQLDGFDLFMDLRDFVSIRRFENKCYGQSREKEVEGRLRKEQEGSLFQNLDQHTSITCESAEAFLGQFAGSFKEQSLDVTERERRLHATADPLYKKKICSENLKKTRELTINRMIRLRRQVPLKLRRTIGEENLVPLSAFLRGERETGKLELAEEDWDLLSEYADEKTRFLALDKITGEMIMRSYDFEVDSDETFAANIKGLETLSARARGYAALLKANPDYMDRLRVRSSSGGESDYTRVMKFLNRQLAISDYYRARCLLITDSHYISHYQDELSPNHDEKTTEDQRYIADLIRLIAQCASRLEDKNILNRTDEDLDGVLSSFEERSRRRPYLFGKADLKKAEISCAAKADREIHDYIDKVCEVRKTSADSQAVRNQVINSVGSPYPEAVDLETDAVKHHIWMIRDVQKLKRNPKVFEELYDEKRRKLNAGLKELSVKFDAIELQNPKTGEVLKVATTFGRHLNLIMDNFCLEVPNDEILEAYEGFAVAQNMEIRTEEDFAYAKKRWLESAKKMFYLEYNALKRMESTYGTLPEQLPIGSFLHSLGPSKRYLHSRWCFVQDVFQMTEEKRCEVDGEKMSLGAYLAKEGWIREDDFRDCVNLNAGYYNVLGNSYENYAETGFLLYGNNHETNEQLSREYDVDVRLMETRKRRKLHGPSISFGAERKLWKDAYREGTETLYGSRENALFKKNQLNLYTEDELHAIQERRINERDLIRRYEETAEGRKAALKADLIQKLTAMNIPVNEELDAQIGKLVVFHPAMMTETPVTAIPQNETNQFIALVKNYAGIGIAEEGKAAARFNAYQKLTERMAAVVDMELLHVNKPQEVRGNDSLIDAATYRRRNGNIRYQSRLMRTILSGEMSDMIQSSMRAEKDKSVIGHVTYELFRNKQKDVVSGCIIKELKKSQPYLHLRDIGNREDSLPDCELAEVGYLLSYMGTTRVIDYDGDHPDDKQRAILKKLYGIEVLRSSDILGIREEKKKKEKEVEQPEKKEEPEIRVIQNMDDKIPVGPDLEVGKKIYIDERSEEVRQSEANKKKEFRVEDYTDEGKAACEDILRTHHHKIPRSMEDLAIKRSPYLEQKTYYIEENGKRRETTDYFWRKNKQGEYLVPEAVRNAYAYLAGYYRARKDMIPEPPEVEYNHHQMAPEKGDHVPYEYQGVNTLYCWACCLAGMMNAYAGKKVSSLDDIRYTKVEIPKFEDSGFAKEKQYEDGVELVNQMMAGKETGNPAIFGDYVLKKLPNTAIRTAHIGAVGRNPALGKRRFLEILGTQLRKGPVGMLYQRHFVLVYGINEDRILVRDSLQASEPDTLREHYHTATQMFSNEGAGEVELVWLENLVGREQQTAAEFQLKYDPVKGQFSGGTETMVKEKILHRDGMEETYVTAEDELVSQGIYLPKQMDKDAAARQQEQQPPAG